MKNQKFLREKGQKNVERKKECVKKKGKRQTQKRVNLVIQEVKMREKNGRRERSIKERREKRESDVREQERKEVE